jgi:hypothetical protein
MEVTLEQLATALTTALTTVLDPDEFDVALGVDSDSRELDVATDDWTLHLEGWPDTIGWLAVDDEPEDPSHFDTARRTVMPEAVEQALARADVEVGGALSRALAASNDPFTLALVHALA